MIVRHRSSREETDIEGYRELQASVSLQKYRYTVPLCCVARRSQKPCFHSLQPLFFPCLSLALHCHWCLLPAPGSAQGNAVGSVLEVAAARQLSGVCGVMEHPGKTSVVHAYSGRDEMLVSPRAGPIPPSFPLQAQSERSCNKCE